MYAATRGRGGIPRTDTPVRDSPRNQMFSPRPAQSSSWSSDKRAPSRGGYGGGWRPQSAQQRPPKDIMENLIARPVQSISSPSLANVDRVEATDVKYLASYTWTNSRKPTMVVPGSPRVWRNLSLPYTVPADAGDTCAYSNAVKVPHSPILPLFLAVDTMEKDGSSEKFDWSSVDFITDRNNLRKLLSWIEAKDNGRSVEDFRIDLKLCGVGTVLMQRWEAVVMYDSQRTGFGESFERSSTRTGPDCEDGMLAGHNRIISYRFHGMKMVVRCEVDACLLLDTASKATPATASTSSRAAGSPSTHRKDLVAPSSADDLVDALATLNITSGAAASSNEVDIVKGGVKVRQSALVKIKTRSSRNAETFDWTSAYLQLFLGQTYNLYLGIHQRGNFNEVRKIDFEAAEMKAAAEAAQPVLKKLGRLLDEILYIVLEHGQEGRLSVVCRGGELKMYQRKDEETFIPDDILARFGS